MSEHTTVDAYDLGGWMDDIDMINNGLWDREGGPGSPDAALAGIENWAYGEVEAAWTLHAAERLAVHGIQWDPATSDEVRLPADMAIADAQRAWQGVLAEWDDWVSRVVEETRAGADRTPEDGVRPKDAPGSRWVTEGSDS